MVPGTLLNEAMVGLPQILFCPFLKKITFVRIVSQSLLSQRIHTRKIMKLNIPFLVLAHFTIVGAQYDATGSAILDCAENWKCTVTGKTTSACNGKLIFQFFQL